MAAFGLTTLILRLIRLARFPGFRRRFDRELGFLTRGPKLIVIAVLAAGIVLPTLFGILVPPKPQRYLPGPAGHESPLAIESLIQEEPVANASKPQGAEPGNPGSGRTAAGVSGNRYTEPARDRPPGVSRDGNRSIEGAHSEPAALRRPAEESALGTRDSAQQAPGARSRVAPDPEGESPRDDEKTAQRSGAAPRREDAALREAVRDYVPLLLEEHAYRQTVSIPPEGAESGALPDAWQGIDILFVHAHPDDESLDFAILMAAAARSDLTIGTLLLTDGEAGVDRYPYRSSYAGYEDRELSGEELGRIRIAEANRALSILGSDFYLRLGLPNHPYNAISDEMQLASLLEAWGGEERLVLRLAEIIRRAAPRVLVSPDVPSDAREHFEHEAAGYLVRKAVEHLRRQDAAPGGYLVSVDPFQRQHYPATVAVPRGAGGRDLRAIQRAALSQHHTQADASVIGIRRLADLPEEYYMPVYWNLEESLGVMLGLEDDLVGRQSPLLEVALAYQQEVGYGSASDVE